MFPALFSHHPQTNNILIHSALVVYSSALIECLKQVLLTVPDVRKVSVIVRL